MAPSQVYTPDADGRRMLVTTRCPSTAQTCSFAAPQLLAFLMHTVPCLASHPESVLHHIHVEVWKLMRSNHFMG